MRLPSTVILLFASTLAAQMPATGGAEMQFAPRRDSPALEACPVRFSVQRQPQGGVAYAANLGEWSRRYANHTLQQQWQLLQKEPGFDQLTQQQQQEKLDQLSAIYRSDSRHHTQGLGVTIVTANSHVVSAEILVHGYPAGTRVIPASAATEEIAEAFHLAATEGIPWIDSPVQTTRIAMVDWLELTRIQFGDGSTWQPSTASHCSTAPSLFVLVDATAR
jgi:hypothetical protein